MIRTLLLFVEFLTAQVVDLHRLSPIEKQRNQQVDQDCAHKLKKSIHGDTRSLRHQKIRLLEANLDSPHTQSRRQVNTWIRDILSMLNLIQSSVHGIEVKFFPMETANRFP